MFNTVKFNNQLTHLNRSLQNLVVQMVQIIHMVKIFSPSYEYIIIYCTI